MSHQFSGIGKKKSLQSSAQGSVIITHVDLTQCAGISIQYLNRLLSMRFIFGDIPHKSIQIGSFVILLALSFGRMRSHIWIKTSNSCERALNYI